VISPTHHPEKEIVQKLFKNLSNEIPVQFDSMWDANAKDGGFISKYIASKFKHIDAVDIIDYSETYKKNIGCPNTNFFVMDNREYIAGCDKTYDLILMEGPFCEIEGGVAEHFGMIGQIVPLTRARGNTVLIFNTVLEPYDYDVEKNHNWKVIRNKFYGKENTSKMNWQFMTPFYINFFKNLGLEVLYCDRVARRSKLDGDKNSIDLNLVVVKRD
jgi:hypothetical protein